MLVYLGQGYSGDGSFPVAVGICQFIKTKEEKVAKSFQISHLFLQIFQNHVTELPPSV